MALELISLKLLATLTKTDKFGIFASKSNNVLINLFSHSKVVESARSSSSPNFLASVRFERADVSIEKRKYSLV